MNAFYFYSLLSFEETNVITQVIANASNDSIFNTIWSPCCILFIYWSAQHHASRNDRERRKRKIQNQASNMILKAVCLWVFVARGCFGYGVRNYSTKINCVYMWDTCTAEHELLLIVCLFTLFASRDSSKDNEPCCVKVAKVPAAKRWRTDLVHAWRRFSRIIQLKSICCATFCWKTNFSSINQENYFSAESILQFNWVFRHIVLKQNIAEWWVTMWNAWKFSVVIEL